MHSATILSKQEPQCIVEDIVQIDEMHLSHIGAQKQGKFLMNRSLIVDSYEKCN